MMKSDRIYRELILCALARIDRVKQQDLAKKCDVSLGLVNKTVRRLEEAHAVEVTKAGVRILSPARILNLWATERRIERDIVHAFRWDSLEEIEDELSGAFLLTAFSAWRVLTGRHPAEYHSLYFYVGDPQMFREWFKFREKKARKTYPNVFVLQTDDPHLLSTSQRGIVPVPQIYVDIYAIDGPQAPPYLRDITQVYPELALW
jgi:DNA-binding Lrp family transcriptional regulator